MVMGVGCFTGLGVLPQNSSHFRHSEVSIRVTYKALDITKCLLVSLNSLCIIPSTSQVIFITCSMPSYHSPQLFIEARCPKQSAPAAPTLVGKISSAVLPRAPSAGSYARRGLG
jgi:hypothetical protein